MNNKAVLSVRQISKNYLQNNGRTLEVLCDISFDVEQNETVAVIGHSGCGKTTLLRIICGFDTADSGEVMLDGIRHEKPDRHNLMLFQDFNQLFPWKTLLANVMHPLTVGKFRLSREEARSHAMKRIADVELSGFEDSYPHQLSGGMKQRGAVARALALQPQILLMDEPFAALDNITRATLQTLTRRVCDKYGIAAVLVTHSVEEAVVMADRIIVMDKNPGRIAAIFDNIEKDGPREQRDAFITEILGILGSPERERRSV